MGEFLQGLLGAISAFVDYVAKTGLGPILVVFGIVLLALGLKALNKYIEADPGNVTSEQKRLVVLLFASGFFLAALGPAIVIVKVFKEICHDFVLFGRNFHTVTALESIDRLKINQRANYLIRIIARKSKKTLMLIMMIWRWAL